MTDEPIDADDAPILKMLHGPPVKVNVPFHLFAPETRYSHALCCGRPLLKLGWDGEGREQYLCLTCRALFLLERDEAGAGNEPTP